MSTWTKKVFDIVGVTEHPVGPSLPELQDCFGGGRVILALDISGSMNAHDAGPESDRQRLQQAVLGCQEFINEAVEARYHVGVILWNHDVANSTAVDQSPASALDLLRSASPSGGNNAVPFLELSHRLLLSDKGGDMVLAIFGDGDLGNPGQARAAAKKLTEDNIRIITCGLGDSSAASLADIATEENVPSATPGSISSAIASMAITLKKRPELDRLT